MSEQKDGGPAFPVVFPERDDALLRSSGLSVRDYFAAQALALGGEWFYNNSAKFPVEVARLAYQVADAMLRARQQEPA